MTGQGSLSCPVIRSILARQKKRSFDEPKGELIEREAGVIKFEALELVIVPVPYRDDSAFVALNPDSPYLKGLLF